MTVIDSFLEKRIRQLLQEYGDPDKVLALLGDPELLKNPESKKNFRHLAEYVYFLWDNSLDTDEDPEEIAGYILEDMGEHPRYAEYAGTPQLKGEYSPEKGIALSEDMADTLEAIENEFNDTLVEEEIRSMEQITEMHLNFERFEEELGKLEILSDIRKLISYLFSGSLSYLAHRKDGEVKKNTLKKIHRDLYSNLSGFLPHEDPIDYLGFLCALAREADLFEVNGFCDKLQHTRFTRGILDNTMTSAELYEKIFKAFWLNLRDHHFHENRETYLDPEDLEFEAASLLLSTAYIPANPEDVYIPAFIDSLLEQQDCQPITRKETRASVLSGLTDAHHFYFRLFFRMGILEKVANQEKREKIQLTPWGEAALRIIEETYSPLLQTEVNLSIAYNIITGFLIQVSFFSPVGSFTAAEEEKVKELQQLSREVDIAINSFFLYVTDLEGDRNNITQVQEVSRFILNKVLSMTESSRKNLQCMDAIGTNFSWQIIDERADIEKA